MLAREVLGIARTDDALGRIAAQDPGRKSDRRADRLELARREGDQQALDGTARAQLEMPGHRLDVPVVVVGLRRRDRLKRALTLLAIVLKRKTA